MSLDKLISAIARICFLASFVFLGVVVAERTVNLFGYTIMSGTYTGRRFLEFAAVLLILVLAVTLRELRDEMRKLNRST